MAQILVSSTTTLAAGSHTLMHNVYTIDQNSPASALYVSGTTGYLGIGTISPTAPLHVLTLVAYTNNAQAIAGGLTVGAFYRNGDAVGVVH